MTDETSSSTAVRGYLRKLQQRIGVVYAVRALVLACGAASATLLAAAFLCDAILTESVARALWLGAAAIAALVLGVSAYAARAYAGAAAARLFDPLGAGLGSRVRTALELSERAPTGTSPELVEAHRSVVQQALDTLPLSHVVPWTWLRHWNVYVGVLAVALAAGLVLEQPRVQTFVHSLLAPAHVRGDGTRVTPITRHITVHLSYPSYLAREATTLVDPVMITAPRGTNLDVRVEPLLPAQRGLLLLDRSRVVLTPAEGGVLRARVAAHDSGVLRVQLESAGVRYEDSRLIALHVLVDKTPRVVIEAPREQALVRPDEVVPLRFFASDDQGVASIDLHMRFADGSEKERVVWSSEEEAGPRAELRASTDLVPSELGLHAGDSLVVWLSARDQDLVSGPNVGKSEELEIEVASEQRRLSAFIPDLQSVADAAVDVLGDRLDDEVPAEPGRAKARFERIETSTRAWLGLIAKLTSAAARAEPSGTLDYDKVAGVRRRNQKLIDEEAGLHRAGAAGLAVRQHMDARNVDELERDVVLLTDLLAKAHIDEAGAIAAELRQLKKRIENLMAKLGKNPSEHDERALMEEIARAKQRLAQLAQSLSRMATRVPGEFMNQEALKQPEAGRTLQELEQAVKRHDLHAAAKDLDSLAKQIDQLAQQIGEGGVRLRESRFGPQDQAMAAARQKLDMLAQEQSRLLDHSRQLAKSGGQNADSQSSVETKQLQSLAQGIGDKLGQMQDRDGRLSQSSAMQRARDRARDANDALRSGDMAAARAAAQGAQQALSQAAAELAAEAQMSPGNGGQAAKNAQLAQRAAEDAQRLAQGIENSRPTGGPSESDRQKLRADVDPQAKTRQAAEQLKEAFEHGPDGLPLSPDGAESLDQAQKAMQRAEQALQHGQAEQAAQEQQAANDGLRKLSEKLAQEQKKQGSEGGPSGSEANTAGAQTPVHIPGAEDFKGPAQLRRKLLDAMREPAPSGFEAAVQRYYQELLR
ncbi:MAG TPA: hypothetical protein VF331_10830 [Polyangiales bacterium]